MKSLATMHDIAEAMAVTKGPRIIEIPGKQKKYVAIYLDADELKCLFAREGYITEGDRHMKQIRRWEDRKDTVLWLDYVLFPIRTPGQKWLAEALAAEDENTEVLDLFGM